MRTEGEAKVLEIISQLTGKDMLDKRFKVVTRGTSHYITDEASTEELRITAFQNNVEKVMAKDKDNKLSAYMLKYIVKDAILVNGSVGKIAKDVLSKFKDMEDYKFNEEDELFQENLDSIKKAFNVCVNGYKNTIESKEYKEGIIDKENKIMKILNERGLELSNLLYHFYGLNGESFDLYHCIDYIRLKFQIDKMNEKLYSCEHKNLIIKKYSYPDNKYVLCKCKKCGLTFNINIVERLVVPIPYVDKNFISCDFIDNALTDILEWVSSNYFDKYIKFLNWVNFEMLKDFEELKNINRLYEILFPYNSKAYSKQDEFYKLHIVKSDNDCVFLSMFGESFEFTDFFTDDNYKQFIKNTINMRAKELEFEIKEEIKKENNMEKLINLLERYPSLKDLDDNNYIKELLTIYNSLVDTSLALSQHEVNGYGLKKYIKFLVGSKDEDITKRSLVNSVYYGRLKHLTEEKIEELIRYLIGKGILGNKLIISENQNYNILSLIYGYELKMTNILEYKLRKGDLIPTI